VISRNKGFTLMEMMIVLAIVAVIFSVALPAYLGYSIRANRAVAKTKLLEVVSLQEQYFADNKVYAPTDLTDLGFATATVSYDSSGNIVAGGASAIYSIALANINNVALTFDVQATPLNSQADDSDCGELAISSSGIKSADGSLSAARCWK
jgi:type IV pilus assembly protein PilE